MAKYLDIIGLEQVFKKIQATYATKSEVNSLLAGADAMIFKGTIGSSGATVTALPNTHNAGWTYKVLTAGTYAGIVCEVGDLIICIKDGTAASNSDWTVAQTNIDGAVTGPTSATVGHIATFNATSGKVIKDSGFTIATSVPANAKFTDTDTNTSHSHGVGTGLSVTGSGGTSGTTTYSVKLKDSTANTNDSAKSTSTAGGLYAVEVDKAGYLAVRVPWTDHTYTIPTVNNAALSLQLAGTTKTTFTSNASSAATFNVPVMTAATSSAAGAVGLVPAPAAGKQGQYLRGDGTWATPTNTDTGVTSVSVSGSGNVVSAASISGRALTLTKGVTALTSHQTVTNKAVTLAWNTTSTIATIGSTNITVKMPANPDTGTTDSAISTDEITSLCTSVFGS